VNCALGAIHFVFARYLRVRTRAAVPGRHGGEWLAAIAAALECVQRLVQIIVVVLQMTGDGLLGLPRRREPDLSGLATIALDTAGGVVSWSVTAMALFGYSAREVVGRDVCDVLLTGPGQRELVARAIAEAAAGHVHTATVAGGSLGEGRFALR